MKYQILAFFVWNTRYSSLYSSYCKIFFYFPRVIQAVEYIKYRWNAKKRHGIHSPFVYDLMDRCLRIPIKHAHRSLLKTLSKTFSSSKEAITIQDFGVGSQKMGNQRKISSILKYSSSTGKYGQLLYRIAQHYSPKHILELGTSLGIGTHYLALGAKDSVVTTVEGCPQTHEIANRSLSSLPNVNSIQGTFDQFFDQLATNTLFDIVFIDGHHDGTALLHYLERLKAYTHDETLFVLDDIRWSDSMFTAWNEVISSSDYHLTLDFFRLGIVLRKETKEKEHFVLRP